MSFACIENTSDTFTIDNAAVVTLTVIAAIISAIILATIGIVAADENLIGIALMMTMFVLLGSGIIATL